MPDAFPKLRDGIDAAPANRDGETFYILYDRAGVTASRLLVSPLGLLIAGRLDGSASVLEVSDNLSQEFGGAIACSEVEKIVDALDEALFLDGDRFEDYQAQAERDFQASPLRPAGSAGSAYAADPVKLAAELDRMLLEAPPPEEPVVGLRDHPRGMIVPHLDFARGAPGYGQAYRLLAGLPAPRTVVVLGTAHVPLYERFALCDKDFDTPMGALPVDRDLASRLRHATVAHMDVDKDILAHRGEHSVELQVVWLRHIYGEKVRILPLLAGSLGEFLDGGRLPEAAAEETEIRAVAGCLADAVRDGGVMVMASADLAHIGPRFGDDREVTNGFLAEVEELDRAYLAALGEGPLVGLETLASHGDSCHICGTASIFTLGMAVPDARTSLLGYHQAVNPEMWQAVTYASMVFA